MINYHFIDVVFQTLILFFFLTCHDACILKFLERIYYDMYILKGHCFFSMPARQQGVGNGYLTSRYGKMAVSVTIFIIEGVEIDIIECGWDI